MITFPKSVAEVASAEGELRAGGTELHERRQQGLASGPLIDLRDVPLRGITWTDGRASIGATTTIAALAADERIAAKYPALALAAGALATPQIRAVATVAGNLIQRSRCWYFRSPEAHCLKKHGDRCWARAGDHLHHACFELGPCVAVHPSTLAMTLLTYDTQVSLAPMQTLSIAELLGDGGDPTRENALPERALVTAIELPAPTAGERGAYFRAIARARSEWPLVEASARLVIGEDGTIREARIAIGGVAPIPLRREASEQALVGEQATAKVLERAAELAAEGAKPLAMNGYKVELVTGTVFEVLERAVHATPTVAPASAETEASTDAPQPEPGDEAL